MKVMLVNSTSTSCSFLDYNESEIEDGYTSNCLLNLFGKPIITRNLSILGSICEIGKSYFAGNAKISNQNIILDSLIGTNVWFGGYSVTANVLLTRNNIQYMVDGKLEDTGKNHFGAVVSNNSSIVQL
jgi:hypothetical protein